MATTLRMDCLSFTWLDDHSSMIQVREQWTTSFLLWSKIVEKTKTYIQPIGSPFWVDGDTVITTRDPRHYELCRVFLVEMAKRKIERYIDSHVSEPEPPRYALPPVPTPHSRGQLI